MMVVYVDSDGPAADEDSVAANSSRQKPLMSIEVHTTANAIVIPTIRTVAADLAARADFDLDSIDDLRMAVDDVCAMLVRAAAPEGGLRATFTVLADRIEVAAEVDADHLVDPLPSGSFDRRVLESLVDEVGGLFLPSASNSAGELTLEDHSSDGSPARAPRGKVRITLTKGALIVPPP
jgi:serine/threonine-protein kinase RsbW